MTQPCMIIDGRPIPISRADYARARRYQPIVASVMGARHAPHVAPTAPAAESAEVKRKAAAFDVMMAENDRQASRESMARQLRLQGIDPKARDAAASGLAPREMTGRELSRASMEKLIRSRGQEPIKR